MTRTIDRIIERLQLINWTNKEELIIFRTKLIDYGNILYDELTNSLPENRQHREVEIQHFMINSIINALNTIIYDRNGN